MAEEISVDQATKVIGNLLSGRGISSYTLGFHRPFKSTVYATNDNYMIVELLDVRDLTRRKFKVLVEEHNNN